MSQKVFSETGWEDYLYWQTQDRKTLNRINRLLQSIERDGVLDGEGQPEKLKYKAGMYSRRIDGKNRLVYKIDGDRVIVESCRGHYED